MTEPTPAAEDEREAQSAYQAALRIVEDMGSFYGLPTKQREFAEKFAFAAIAAGFRLHPTPSVDDVALWPILEVLWDDGNCTGLDGWIGPGRGSETDDEALVCRERALDKAATAVIALFGGEG